MSPLPPLCANSHDISIRPPRLLGQGTPGSQTIGALTFWETKISGCLVGHGKCLTAFEDTGVSVATASRRVSPTGIRGGIV